MRGILKALNTRLFSSTLSLSRKVFDRSPVKFTKPDTREATQPNNDREDENNGTSTDSTDSTEFQFLEFASRFFRTPVMGHQVFIIQPYIKWGPEKKRNTTPELQLAEAETLVKTLDNWRVVDTAIISMTTFDRKTFFGKGNVQTISTKIYENDKISAVFLSVNMLKGYQQKELEKAFRVPVYDRYRIVLQIFQEHAKTREAKLQLQLAQIPYLYSKANYNHMVTVQSFTVSSAQCIKDRQNKLKDEIAKLKSQRQLIRQRRIDREVPVVAVVGYTNAGKTSLIKALSESKHLEPKNVLFATLDVTVHEAWLPCRLKILFVDTIGFISDIPTFLLESFQATLEDAMLADVVLHVRDASHPDKVAQNENVMTTLQKFELPEQIMNNIIVVDNKIDLLEPGSEVESDGTVVSVSAEKKTGLAALMERIENTVLEVTGKKTLQIRVPSGGEEYTWLRREAAVSHVEADEKDAQYCIVHCIISTTNLAKFKHYFIHSKKPNRTQG